MQGLWFHFFSALWLSDRLTIILKVNSALICVIRFLFVAGNPARLNLFEEGSALKINHRSELMVSGKGKGVNHLASGPPSWQLSRHYYEVSYRMALREFRDGWCKDKQSEDRFYGIFYNVAEQDRIILPLSRMSFIVQPFHLEVGLLCITAECLWFQYWLTMIRFRASSFPRIAVSFRQDSLEWWNKNPSV